jgi:hypothetical protein
VDDFDDDHDDEFEDEGDKVSTVRAGSCQGEKGVVEVSEEIRDGKMGLTET